MTTKLKDKHGEYGVFAYTPRQKQLHIDIMRVLKFKKHREIPADECQVVFGRIYSIYVQSQLLKEGVLQIPQKKGR